MKTVYVKDGGKKVYVEVTDEVAVTLKTTRNAIWSNDAYERYHCGASLSAMTDRDRRTSCADSNPEMIYIAIEEQAELRANLSAALKTLTPAQSELLKMLYKGMSVTEIAKTKGISKASVCEARKWLQKKFDKFLL